MRKLLISTLVSLAGVAPVLAQDAPQGDNAAPNSTQNQQDLLRGAVQSFEQRVQARLAQAGYSDIEMIPTSFLIRAKDADGNPVMLMLSPDSANQPNEGTPGQGSGRDAPDEDQADDSMAGTPRGQVTPHVPGAEDM